MTKCSIIYGMSNYLNGTNEILDEKVKMNNADDNNTINKKKKQQSKVSYIVYK